MPVFGNNILPFGSPPIRSGTPPPVVADRIIRARKGNPPQLQFSELTPDEISATSDCLVNANGLTDAFLLNAVDNRTKRLNLTSCYHIRKYTLGMIAQQCLGLESIDLSNCRQADNRMVCNLLVNCHFLKELILDGCVRITDAAFFPPNPDATILGLCRLTKLSLAGCRQISEDAFLRIANTCHNLESINLSGCRTSVTMAVVHAFFDQSLERKNLTRIGLSDTAVLSSDKAFLQYQDKLNLSSSLLPIETIYLSGLSGLPPKYSHKTVSALAHMCGHNLIRLETTWCGGITDESCYALAMNCPNLRYLNLCNSQISSNGIELLATHLFHLESLNVSWCLKVNSIAVQSMAKCMHSLRRLCLNHCVDFLAGPMDKSAISSGDICALVFVIGHHLEELELVGIPKIANSFLLDSISTHCHSLTHLSISLGEDSVDSLLQLAITCESITHLYIDSSRIMADISSTFKYPNFPNLTKLTLVCNPRMPANDSTLEAILVNRIGLEHLEIRNCGDVSNELFQNWIQGYNPDREAARLVGAMIDSELQRGYMSSSSAPATVIGKNSDSEAPTVVFRGRPMSRRSKRMFNPLSSASETEGILGQFDFLSLVLSDAARALDGLKSLTLTGASKLTAASLDRLSLMATYMQNLELIDCPFITDDCVELLRRRCRLLRALEITGPKLRVRIDSSRFYSRKHRRKGQLPPPGLLKRKIINSDDDDD